MEEAGGAVIAPDRITFLYNKEQLRNSGFIAVRSPEYFRFIV